MYKKGDRCVPNNYHPVILTSVVYKALETIIKDELFRYFNRNNLFTAYQHGFWPGYSCVTQLINVMEDWTCTIECGKSVGVMYHMIGHFRGVQIFVDFVRSAYPQK